MNSNNKIGSLTILTGVSRLVPKAILASSLIFGILGFTGLVSSKVVQIGMISCGASAFSINLLLGKFKKRKIQLFNVSLLSFVLLGLSISAHFTHIPSIILNTAGIGIGALSTVIILGLPISVKYQQKQRKKSNWKTD